MLPGAYLRLPRSIKGAEEAVLVSCPTSLRTHYTTISTGVACCPVCLRTHYAVSGTDRASDATRSMEHCAGSVQLSAYQTMGMLCAVRH